MDIMRGTDIDLQSSYSSLAADFTASLRDLRALSMLRLDDSAMGLFDEDLSMLQRQIRALEDRLTNVQKCIKKEKQAMAGVHSFLDLCALQTMHLNHVSSQMQQRPPQQPLPALVPDHEDQLHAVPCAPANAEGQDVSASMSVETPLPNQEVRKRKMQAPCRYVSEAEYKALSSYMTQRIPLSKVNAALEDAADLAEGNKRMLSQAKAGAKMPSHEWKRAQTLLINIANKDVVRGKFWLTDADLKKSSTLRADKTGKAIMTILRHLGRVAEIRLLVDGKAESIYILPSANEQ